MSSGLANNFPEPFAFSQPAHPRPILRTRSAAESPYSTQLLCFVPHGTDANQPDLCDAGSNSQSTRLNLTK